MMMLVLWTIVVAIAAGGLRVLAEPWLNGSFYRHPVWLPPKHKSEE